MYAALTVWAGHGGRQIASCGFLHLAGGRDAAFAIWIGKLISGQSKTYILQDEHFEHRDLGGRKSVTILNQYALHLQARADFAAAEPLMQRALAIDEQSLGPEHPKVAIRLNNLARLLKVTNRLVGAEPLMRRALAIDEQSLGPEHPRVAIRLNNLAGRGEACQRRKRRSPMWGLRVGCVGG